MPRRKRGRTVRIAVAVRRCCRGATESPKIRLFGLSVSILLAVVKIYEITVQLVSAAT
jgi:hypothetical protein